MPYLPSNSKNSSNLSSEGRVILQEMIGTTGKYISNLNFKGWFIKNIKEYQYYLLPINNVLILFLWLKQIYNLKTLTLKIGDILLAVVCVYTGDSLFFTLCFKVALKWNFSNWFIYLQLTFPRLCISLRFQNLSQPCLWDFKIFFVPLEFKLKIEFNKFRKILKEKN